MIISEKVKIIGNSKNLKHYINKGYDIEYNKEIYVNVLDLTNGSTFEVLCSCDNCKKEIMMIWSSYYKFTKKLTENYYCKGCKNIKTKKSNLERYGVESPLQNKNILKKLQETNLERYGNVCSLQNEKIREYIKKNNIEKFGFKTPLENETIKKKIKLTNLNKYGFETPLQNKQILDKVKRTNLEKYGVENIFQSEDIKNKIKEKYFKKYGVEYCSQVEEFKSKSKETFLNKYGVSHPMKSDEIFNKVKKTNLEKYGVESFLKLGKNRDIGIENMKKNIRYKNFLKYLKKYNNNNEYEFISYENRNEIKFTHKKCSNIFIINSQQIYKRAKHNIILCTKCYPISDNKSIKEKEISNWLKSTLCSSEYNVDFAESNRIILNGKELDIYIPSKKLAIEFNGLYWHSEFNKDKNYHLDKSIKCQEKGIHLLHIWEDEWVFKKDIIKSIILNKIGKIENKIYARHCDIRIVEDSKLVRKFLDENHIQGYSQSSLKLGLYYQYLDSSGVQTNELVSLMTFGYRHTNSKKEFELIRFCNKINLNVIGAASKLFKYFCNNYQFNELISYSDFRLFDGKMYETLGFTKQHLSKPDYFWCKGLERKHRFNFNKQKLIKEGFDGSKTEVEIMHEREYFRVFGCGQYRWLYKNI